VPIPRVIFDRVRGEIERELADLVPRIVEELRPQKIILFGSAARGEAGEMSDIDLCVIADTDLPFFDRVSAVHKLWQGNRVLQVFVYTPGEWRRMREEGRGFIRTIVEEGRVLYEAG
jgi:predicted nucleotidyltransferase